jgi:hypothetical protein
MKKIMMCAAFIAAMAIFSTSNAQGVKKQKTTKTEQCDKKCEKPAGKDAKCACKKGDAKKCTCKKCTCKANAKCAKSGQKCVKPVAKKVVK